MLSDYKHTIILTLGITVGCVLGMLSGCRADEPIEPVVYATEYTAQLDMNTKIMEYRSAVDPRVLCVVVGGDWKEAASISCVRTDK